MSPNDVTSVKSRLSIMKQSRPSTSQCGSRKVSRGRDSNLLARNKEDQNMYDATQISASKLVSISDLMKNNLNNTQIKIDYEHLDTEDTKLAETMKQVSQLSAYKDGRRTEDKTNRQRIMAMLRGTSPDKQSRLEKDLMEKIKNIKTTDEETLAKILTFATDMDQRMGGTMQGTIETSPHRNDGMVLRTSQSSKQIDGDLYKTINGLAESRVGVRTSIGGNSVFEKTKFEKMMIHKMAYEWKNVYRMLTVIDQKGLGIIPISEFQSCCERCKVSIVPLEQKQLMK